MGKCRYSAGRVHNDDMPLRYQWFMALLYILLGTLPTISLPIPQTETHLGPGFFKRNLKMWTMRWVCWAWTVFGKVDATGPATFDLWGRWVEFPYLKHLLPRPHGLRFNHFVHIWFETFDTFDTSTFFRKESIEHVGTNFCFGVYRCQVWLLHNGDLGWTWKWCSWHRITFLTAANHLPL